MPILGKRRCMKTTAQTSYWRRRYGKMRAALESRVKHNTLENTFVVLKSRKQGRTLLLATFRSFRSFRSVPFRSGFYQHQTELLQWKFWLYGTFLHKIIMYTWTNIVTWCTYMEVKVGHKIFLQFSIIVASHPRFGYVLQDFFLPWGCMEWDFSLLDDVHIWNSQTLSLLTTSISFPS